MHVSSQPEHNVNINVKKTQTCMFNFAVRMLLDALWPSLMQNQYERK